MWGNLTLFRRAKSIEKKYREKINIDTIIDIRNRKTVSFRFL